MTAVTSQRTSGTVAQWRPRTQTTNVTSVCLLRRMADDWRTLVSQAATQATVAIWRQSEPALANWDLVASLEGRDSEAVLGALLRLYRAGDELARRAIFQAMLPKSIRLAQSQRRWMSSEDAQSATAAAMLMAITTCSRRGVTRRIARELALEALHQLTRSPGRSPEEEILGGVDVSGQGDYFRDGAHPGSSETWRGPVAVDQTDDLTPCLERIDNERVWASVRSPRPSESPRSRRHLSPPQPVEDPTAPVEGELATVLLTAVGQQIITGQDAELLLAVYGNCSTDTRATAAARFGISEANLRTRCSRAVRALRESAYILVPEAA